MNGLSDKLREFLIKEPIILERMNDNIEKMTEKCESNEKCQMDLISEIRERDHRLNTKQDEILKEIALLKQNEEFQTERIKSQGASQSKSTGKIKAMLWKILFYVMLIASTLGIGTQLIL